MRAPDHPQNAARLAALAAYGILDTQASVNFDEITALVSRICDTPIALISLVDRDRQWFLSEKGLGMRRTSMESSVCAHAILQDEFFEIDDLTADARFADNPMVLGHPHIRFYAGAVLRDPGGLPMGMLCVIDDRQRRVNASQRRSLEIMARRVMREIELHRIAHQARSLAGQLSVAISNRRAILEVVSEELRTPLNTIAMTATLMARPGSVPDQVAFARGLGEAAQHMTDLVDDLLDIAVLEEAQMTLRPVGVDAGALIAEAARRAHAQRAESAQTLKLDISADLGPVIWDRGRISQLIEYLVDDALAFSQAAGEVGVSVSTDGARLVIRITDRGSVIAAHRVETLFEPFVQGRPAKSRSGGPRLAVVRGIAEAHGGTVDARSDPGATCLTVVLPRSAPDAAPNDGSTECATLPPGAALR